MKVAFKTDIYRGFQTTAYYLSKGSDAKIVIKKDKKIFKTFLYPAYRIFNIASHFREMIDDAYYLRGETEEGII